METLLGNITIDKKACQAFRKRLIRFLARYDEYLTPGIKTKYILNVMDRQGYWSGDSINVYMHFKKFYVEHRVFGRDI